MTKIFESQLRLIIGIFAAEDNDDIFLILILAKSFFCLQLLKQSFGSSFQHLLVICQRFLKKQISCLYIGRVELKVEVTHYCLFR